jgi:hypothetical protein
VTGIAETILSVSRFALPALGLAIFGLCARRLLRQRSQAPPAAFLLNPVNRDKLPLERFENSLGRSPHCDVVLGYSSVSRFHAVIARRRQGWVVIDTGSKGGTKLDGLPVKGRAALRNGQRLTFGAHAFVFCDAEEERRGGRVPAAGRREKRL